MTRQQAIAMAAKDVAEAADYGRVGSVDIFGSVITEADITTCVSRAVGRLQAVIGMTDAEWDSRWSDSVAEENRVEADARKFAAGKL